MLTEVFPSVIFVFSVMCSLLYTAYSERNDPSPLQFEITREVKGYTTPEADGQMEEQQSPEPVVSTGEHQSGRS